MTFTHGYEKAVALLLLVISVTLYGQGTDSIAVTVVTASAAGATAYNNTVGAFDLPISQLDNIPSLAGEVDLVRSLQLLPGVQPGADGATGLIVRGGGYDENMILLDGFPLYSVDHLMGYFSIFNADAVKNVTLYKGGFPSRFGGRISSVVDVRMCDGNFDSWHGSASLGLISARVCGEGPIVKDAVSLLVSVRRTWLDAVEKLMSSDSDGFGFYDVNMKLTAKLSERDVLSAGMYLGNDKVEMDLEEDDVQGDSSAGWGWGNRLAYIRWAHIFRGAVKMSTSAGYSSYSNQLEYEGDDYDLLTYGSGIGTLLVQSDFEHRVGQSHSLRWGFAGIRHSFAPSVTSAKSQDIDTVFSEGAAKALELALYVEDEWKMTELLSLTAGLRDELFVTSDRTFHYLEPRLNVRFQILENCSVKASYCRMSQFAHLQRDASMSLPSDRWLPSCDTVAPAFSHQLSAGAFCSFLPVDISAELYWKNMDKVLDSEDGIAYGGELLVRKTIGRLSGWTGYSLTMSDRPGVRRHSVSVTASLKLTDKIDLSSNFIYGSGYSLSDGYQVRPYHRLDVGMNFHRRFRNGADRTVGIGVYNVYNRDNQYVVRIGNRVEEVSLFTIMPSITYSFRF